MKRLTSILALLFLILPFSVSATELEGPVEGKAKVYFFNYGGTIMGGRGAVNMFKDKAFLGHVKSSTYYNVDLDPGKCVLWAKIGNKKWFIKADVEAGKTYYVHIQTIAGKGFNPIPSPMLLNASKNFKKGKASYKGIMKRLKKSKFEVESDNTEAFLQQKSAELAADIDAVWTKWESDWKDARKWNKITISPKDGM